ncbi:glycosyltransferase [Streptomyces zingiberis]|uniref:D-inositol 3-phosphate glycosyltransferase n=1 Tax=Streptomyces zingiberis TaxID=2053010 RepID=A0ABX1BVR1_9ACTN|nr:glycosyltransferase [Streptomyces zingiberis]NJQ01761.1 glycosyltransferase family 4 protein [Streptomyces zingiberis]
MNGDDRARSGPRPGHRPRTGHRPGRHRGSRAVFLVGIDVDSMGGSQRVLHTLAQGFGERGHRVELIGIRPSPEPYRYPHRGGPAYRHSTLYSAPAPPRRPPARTLGERLAPARVLGTRAARAERSRARERLLRRFAAVERGYVVIGSPWAADWLLALHWPHLKGIGQYHESFAQARASRNLGLILRHYPRLEKALFLSEGDAAAFRRERLPNAAYMPNPLPFTPPAPAPLDTRRIGAVGRLEEVKRLDRLVDAFAALAPDHPGWELHFFGEGPLEPVLRERAARLGCAERVVFRGAVRDVAAAYREVSVLALTSEREGRPMAVAEAAACGVPAVSFDLSGGVRELVADGRTGRLVRAGDRAAFTAALRELVADDALRTAYGRAAREHVAPLALPAVLDRWEELFDEIDR